MLMVQHAWPNRTTPLLSAMKLECERLIHLFIFQGCRRGKVQGLSLDIATTPTCSKTELSQRKVQYKQCCTSCTCISDSGLIHLSVIFLPYFCLDHSIGHYFCMFIGPLLPCLGSSLYLSRLLIGQGLALLIPLTTLSLSWILLTVCKNIPMSVSATNFRSWTSFVPARRRSVLHSCYTSVALCSFLVCLFSSNMLISVLFIMHRMSLATQIFSTV